jgi:hypothetical protein
MDTVKYERTESVPDPKQDEKATNPTPAEAKRGAAEMDIDPENEVKGLKLLVIHTGICLCTFLIGLVKLSQRITISQSER